MNIREIFLGSDDRLRSGYRVVLFVLGFIFVASLFGLAGQSALVASGLIPGLSDSALLVFSSLISLTSAIFLGWIAGKVFEGVPFRALGAGFNNGWLKHLVFGIFVGAATLTLAVALAYAFGGLRFTSATVASATILRSLGISFLIFAIGAASEEALFRGYILQTLSRSGLAWLGIALTSIFFGGVHLGNPSATAIATLNTMLAGVWFGIAYLKTRDLWFVWGMHLMWNWMQGSFFGIEVSGLTDLVSVPLLKEIDSGPVWLTGETYGIEGGIASTIALILSIVVIWYMPFLKPSEAMRAMSEPPAVAGG